MGREPATSQGKSSLMVPGPALSTWGVGKDGGGARVTLRSEPETGGSLSVVPGQLHQHPGTWECTVLTAPGTA